MSYRRKKRYNEPEPHGQQTTERLIRDWEEIAWGCKRKLEKGAAHSGTDKMRCHAQTSRTLQSTERALSEAHHNITLPLNHVKGHVGCLHIKKVLI